MTITVLPVNVNSLSAFRKLLTEDGITLRITGFFIRGRNGIIKSSIHHANGVTRTIESCAEKSVTLTGGSVLFFTSGYKWTFNEDIAAVETVSAITIYAVGRE